MAASRYIVGAGSVTLTNGVAPTTLNVIDWICFTYTQPASAVDATIAIDGNTVARKKGTNSAGDMLYLEFPTGYPCWSASDTDSAVDTSVAVVGACTGGTNISIVVGYHWESPAARRGDDR